MYTLRNVHWRITLRYAWRAVLAFALLDAAVAVAYLSLGVTALAVEWLPLSLIGTAVAFTVGFKNNQAYARFWEARRLWGDVVNASRAWTAQTTTLLFSDDAGSWTAAADRPDEALAAAAGRRALVRRHLAWANVLRQQLRGLPWREEAARWVPPAEVDALEAAPNRAAALLQRQAAALAEARTAHGLLTDLRHLELLRTLARLQDAQGGCERIKNTPLPRQYAYYSTVFVRLFCVLVPFGLVRPLGWYSIPFGVLVSWVFYTLETVGSTSEDPFENQINDVPMSAICRVIERDALYALGEAELPPAAAPVDGVLL